MTDTRRWVITVALGLVLEGSLWCTGVIVWSGVGGYTAAQRIYDQEVRPLTERLTGADTLSVRLDRTMRRATARANTVRSVVNARDSSRSPVKGARDSLGKPGITTSDALLVWNASGRDSLQIAALLPLVTGDPDARLIDAAISMLGSERQYYQRFTQVLARRAASSPDTILPDLMERYLLASDGFGAVEESHKAQRQLVAARARDAERRYEAARRGGATRLAIATILGPLGIAIAFVLVPLLGAAPEVDVPVRRVTR